MDAALFDRLARFIGGATPRRSLLAALAALTPAFPAAESVWAKKRKKKKKNKKKKKGKSTPGGCSATADANGGMTHSTQMSVKGKTLSLTQTEQPFGPNGTTGGRMDLSLNGAPLLTVDSTIGSGRVTVTVTYGDAFSGVRQASFTNDGATITGAIDGRALLPLSASADPAGAQFADGAPLPDVQVDPDLVKAMQALLSTASGEAVNCGAKRKPVEGKDRAKRRRRGVGAEDVDPTIQPGCLLLLAACQTGWVGCQFGVAAGCLSATILYGVCFAAGSLGCIVAQEGCRRRVRHNAPCCPVRCGGDAELSLWGDDPSCCVGGESCLDANDNRKGCCVEGARSCHGRSCCFDDQDCESDGICCARGYSSCGGACCPDGSCLEGSCCAPPSGVACGGTCCPPFTRNCCNNSCCDGDCVDNRICCRAPNEACVNNCCAPGKCCNGVCCGNDETCQNNVCRQVCSPTIHETCPNLPGYASCCPKGTNCCSNGECCPNFAPVCCGSGCCLVGQECCPDNVCRSTCIR